MTDTTTPNNEQSQPATVAAERPVRPSAWKCSTCGGVSECEGALRGDNWCQSCGACLTMRPMYDEAALDAAVAAERERWKRMLIAAANEAARQAAYGHEPVITVTDDGWRCNWPT